MYDGLLLTVHTTLHRYLVRRDQLAELRIVDAGAGIEGPDERGRPLLTQELGPLLDPRDQGSSSRRHALLVPTRRRSIALLVARIEDFETMGAGTIRPLPPWLLRRLARPWLLGVGVRDDTPVLVLDLRQIAQDVLLGVADQRP